MLFDRIQTIRLDLPSAHASSIAYHNGRLHVAWFGGTREKHPDTAIYLATQDGNEWTAKRLAKLSNKLAHWNPILFVATNGELICYFKVGESCDNWKTWYVKSQDGNNWSHPRVLVRRDKSVRGPSRNKPISLRDGSIIAPGSDEAGYWRCFIDRSEDGGETWTKSDEISAIPLGSRIIQPALWESERGVHLLARSDSGYLYRCDSIDGGRVWGRPYITSIPNNNSAIDILDLGNGKLLMAMNPVARNWGIRTPLSLLISNNYGDTWEYMMDIERRDQSGSEYSYPSMANTPDGVMISYTVDRLAIRLCRWQYTEYESVVTWNGAGFDPPNMPIPEL